MKTLLLSEEQTEQAAEIIKRGGLVAMPTETVYGLAADAFNGKAVADIFRAKGRPMDNPLIVHISDISQIFGIVREFPEKARLLAEKFWPGPLTIILPKACAVPDEVSAGLDTVAVRFPSNETARKLISASCPLAAPSANLSGSPSPTSAEHVMKDMNGRIDAVIDGGVCDVGVESTVITLAGDVPRILRPGGITAEQIEEVIGSVEIDRAVTEPLEEGQTAASPGMKYKHYSPKAEVILLEGDDESFEKYINDIGDDKSAALCYNGQQERLSCVCIPIGDKGDYTAYAHNLFSALRRADDMGCMRVFAHCPGKDGVGLAVYNRVIRASGFRIISL